MASILRLVPKVDSQSSWTWDDDIKPILQNPEKYSFNEVVGKLKDNISAWDDEDRNAQRRQAIWILILIAYYLGKGEQEHGEIILDLVYEWDFQDDLFHEQNVSVFRRSMGYATEGRT